MNHRNLCRFVAAATLLTVLVRWSLFMMVADFGRGSTGDFLALLSLAALCFALVSVVGLWDARGWGFVAFYLFVGLFTILFGAALIPYILLLVPFGLRTAGVFATNGLVLVAVAFLHMRRRG